MVADWRQSTVRIEASIRDAIQAIDRNPAKICLVVDDAYRLITTVTDGDIRRIILKNVSLESTIAEMINNNPITAAKDESRESLLRTMREKNIKHLPIVDEVGTLLDLVYWDQLMDQQIKRPNRVVIMAGGLGQRLLPLTSSTPKPLIMISGKPILELIIENLIEQNFEKIIISVNYKARDIINHFGDGTDWNIEIKYLEETERLGTAGSLNLIGAPLDDPILVMNGDLLTKVDFGAMLEFHTGNHSVATMAVKYFEHEFPYGVVNVDQTDIVSIIEKPTQSWLINAGIYVIDPETIEKVGKKSKDDMPEYFQRLINIGMKCSVFPLREYWLDIGRMGDLEKARIDYQQEFEN